MRSQKVIPAETGFDAPVYETLYTYGYLGEDEHIVQNTVAESADGQYLSYRQYNNINASGQAEYGRLTVLSIQSMIMQPPLSVGRTLPLR
jgi:hypothetical protein